jgi:hypothetical protein
MGGYGFGQPGYRPRAEQMKRLDLARLRRNGYLSGFPVRLSWSYGGEPIDSIGLQAQSDGVRLFSRSKGLALRSCVDEGNDFTSFFGCRG